MASMSGISTSVTTAAGADEVTNRAVDAARAQVRIAELNLSFTKVLSLIDGIVGITQVQIGNLVTPTSVLTTVSPPSLEQEAIRDLCRCREDARADLGRCRHRTIGPRRPGRESKVARPR